MWPGGVRAAANSRPRCCLQRLAAVQLQCNQLQRRSAGCRSVHAHTRCCAVQQAPHCALLRSAAARLTTAPAAAACALSEGAHPPHCCMCCAALPQAMDDVPAAGDRAGRGDGQGGSRGLQTPQAGRGGQQQGSAGEARTSGSGSDAQHMHCAAAAATQPHEAAVQWPWTAA